MVLVMSALSFLTLSTRLRPRGPGYRVLWLVRAETGGSSETALLLLTLRWNEKSRGLRGVMGVRMRPGQASRGHRQALWRWCRCFWGYFHKYLFIARSNVPCTGAMAGKVDSVSRIQYAKNTHAQIGAPANLVQPSSIFTHSSSDGGPCPTVTVAAGSTLICSGIEPRLVL